MLAFIGRRILSTFVVLFVVSLVVYGLTLLIPGDAAQTLAGGVNATPEQVEQVRTKLGLDDPYLVQYGRWVKGAVVLNFGKSLFDGRPTSDEIRAKLPATASIVFGAVVFGSILGLAVGIYAGVRAGTKSDRALISATTLGIAMPNFWLAMLLLWIFAVKLGWFPVLGYTPFTKSPMGWLRSIALPSVALGVFVAASLARQVRGELATVMQQAYIRTAWAKGASMYRVVGKHALKNAVIPAITILGYQLAGLIGATIIVEQIFSIPGLGTYLLQAIQNLDIPAIMGVTTMFVLMYLVIGLVVDIAYTIVNPKVRLS
jgi:peptide/nickel transport system permease protein